MARQFYLTVNVLDKLPGHVKRELGGSTALVTNTEVEGIIFKGALVRLSIPNPTDYVEQALTGKHAKVVAIDN